jgi:hypothetical protein
MTWSTCRTRQIRQLRQLLRRTDPHPFLPVQLAADQTDLAFGNPKRLGQKRHQIRIGLAFNRRRSQADLQAIAVQPAEIITAGRRLQVTLQNQVVTFQRK